MVMWSALIPPFLHDWLKRCLTLREFHRQNNATFETLDMRVRWKLEDAYAAMEAGNHDVAWGLWKEALEQYPTKTKASNLSIEILLRIRRLDEAEGLIAEAQVQRPSDQSCAEAYARVAQQRGDHDEASRRWKIVRKRFPRSMQGYAFGSECLAAGGRSPEADAIMKAGLRKFGDNIVYRIQYAKLATMRDNHAEALTRWEYVRDRFHHIAGYRGVGLALQRLGRLDEAERVMSDVRSRFPIEFAPAVDLANLPLLRDDTEEALKRWHTVRERFPLVFDGYKESARLLRKLGRYDELDTLLEETIERFPSERLPLIEYALSARLARKWPDVVQRCCALRTKFPDCVDAYTWAADALVELGERAAAAEMAAASRDVPSLAGTRRQ